MSSAMSSLVFEEYVLKFSATWAASSRVGARTSERGIRARDLPRPRSVIRGRVNDAVFPVPVCAIPSTSRPAIAGGIA